MRGVAALCVVFFHGGVVFDPRLAPKAYLAVDFFFCLSGFIICHAYGGRLSTQGSIRYFLLSRFIRLYPLYLLGTLLGLVKLFQQIHLHHHNAPTLLNLTLSAGASILMLPSWSPGNYLYPLNPVAWSLFFEIIVNTIYATVWPSLKRGKLLYLVIGFGSGLAFTILVIYNGNVELGPFWNDFVGAFLRTFVSFNLGVLVYKYKHLSAHTIPPLLLLTVLILSLMLPFWGSTLYDLLFCFLLSPLLVLLGAGIEGVRLQKAVFSLLGDISYPLYMLHAMPISALGYFIIRFKLDPLVPTVLLVCLLVAISLAVERNFDRPIRKWLARRLLRT